MSKKKWDEQFSKHAFTYGKLVNEFIKAQSHHFPADAHIACFAEGEGRNAVYLAKKGLNITAYDQSIVALQNAHLLAAENNTTIHTIEKDLTEPLEKRDYYDGAIMVFGHVPKDKQSIFLNNIIQSVKCGGYILFEVYSERQLPYDTGGPGSINHLYKAESILEWISPHEIKHFYYGEVERVEGYRHTGTGHVIQVMIKKQ